MINQTRKIQIWTILMMMCHFNRSWGTCEALVGHLSAPQKTPFNHGVITEKPPLGHLGHFFGMPINYPVEYAKITFQFTPFCRKGVNCKKVPNITKVWYNINIGTKTKGRK